MATLYLGVAGEGVLADEWDGLVGREVVLVVGEDAEAERADGAVGGVAGDDVDLAAGQGAVEQAEVHDAGRGKGEAVGLFEAGEAVGPGLELVADTEAHVGRVGLQVGDGLEVEPVGFGAGHDHGEGVLEAEAALDLDVEAGVVERGDGVEDGGLVADGGQRLLEDGGERGAGVLDVAIDAAADERLLAEIAAGEIEAALDLVGLAFGLVDGFDLLGEELAEDDLFGEVLGADDDLGAAWGGAGGEEEEWEECEQAVHGVEELHV